MTGIIRKYWIWDEKLNTSNFKLGDSKEELVNKGFIDNNVDSSGYHKVLEGIPNSVAFSEEEKLSTIIFKEKFFNSFDNEILELEFNDFLIKIENYLIPCEEKYKGDVLHVVFRGFFPAFTMIRRKK
ncbi:hypothetical protein EV195_101250 [Tenacibaculum skagerrakense]|uniref:Uncharacterized protein n=1 Tax=Tenacibaculum skagerrakense TaxID=186571 RepID=A0A4R2P0G4_9FLAO|nr:hypothetical protein [Tenacibaculum skagerrakense]TCP28090.1 hypothetical protein EV195_101250 [Tenacibaculum skagerrakense]